MSDYKIFQNGCAWVRADFHLHTRKDKEFQYKQDENQFVKTYVDALKKADIRVGVITNHNKFDLNEFKALKKEAIKEEIFLLPGIELSVKDGKNSVHTLVVFNYDWICNKENKDYINDFLGFTFSGQSNYDNENSNSNHNLPETIKALDNYARDYFLLFAHVEDNNGLWDAFEGGRIIELGKEELFKNRALGFQKVRTHDIQDRKCRVKVQDWLGDWYPAEIEGSDCKAIEEIGRGDKCYLKIGDYIFESVKFALLDYKNRVAEKPIEYKHSHITSIGFEGGILDGRVINFSPELNTFIGIRGSGKSSILESLRYVLDIPFGDKVMDLNYKDNLVAHTLGSGGKIILKATDKRGIEYEIRRILNEQPDIYAEGRLQPGISIKETIISKPIYFGQKDLSSSGEGFEKDLVEKLLGSNLSGIRDSIEAQRQKVSYIIANFKRTANIDEKKKEYEAKKKDADYNLRIYQKYGIEDKLQKQVYFELDSRKCSQIISTVNEYLNDLEQLINSYEDDLINNQQYKSKQNEEFFNNYFLVYKKLIDSFNLLKKAFNYGKSANNELIEKNKEFDKFKIGLKEEFAGIERMLAEEIKEKGELAISPDEFLKLRKISEQAAQMLKALEKQETQQINIKDELISELTKLNDLWHEEFAAMQTELKKINENHSSLQVIVEFKGDKKSFVEYMKNIFRGSKIRESTFENIANKFTDFGDIFKNFEKAKIILGNSASIFEEYFNDNLPVLLTWQAPNKFIIKYRDKELKRYSLGQRASALILFVLSQHENDLIIIDQPEDDLDNQTIYEDVIKLILQLKRETQFVFATHNANIPVLGDSECICSCDYTDEKLFVSAGNIDCPKTQQEIVDIMEGGKEAFNRRKEIYKIWKIQNFSR